MSYFVNLANLSAGDEVRYESPCTTYVFKVQGHTIVQQGAPVYDTPGPTVTLVTCWPTNALWFTPQRYVVTAMLVGSSPTGGANRTFVAAADAPLVPVPAALASQGVTLATYSVPMGTMTLAGKPDPSWAQTTNPLLVEDAAVEAYIAGVRALNEDRLDWWSALAPSVVAPAPLIGARESYDSALDVTIRASGDHATSVELTVTVGVNKGSAPGRYAMTVDEGIEGGRLVITSWVLRPT